MRKPLTERAREDVSLYNPAFLALLFRRTVDGYYQEHKEGLPLLLGHLSVSMCLTAEVRDSLTMRSTTRLSTWAASNPRARIAIPRSTAAFSPFINEAVLFALHHDVLRLTGGVFISGTYGPTIAVRGETQEVVACQKAATFIGKWFAASGSHSTIAALLGVRP